MRAYKMRIHMLLTSLAAAVCLAAAGCGGESGQQAAAGYGGGSGQQAAAGYGEGSGQQSPSDHIQSEPVYPAGGAGHEAGSEADGQSGPGTGRAPFVYGTDLKDGVYSITVDSSSSMFRVTECELTVKDGAMEAVMTMGGTGYLKLYMGTGAEAEEGDESGFIPYIEQADGTHAFKVPVEALDQEIACSAFSRKKEAWYDRVLVFRSDCLPAEAFAGREPVTAKSLGLADGDYLVEISLEGGSGRASVESPARIHVEDGKVTATVVWGSANYDYMVVDGEKIIWDGTEEKSTFQIPVAAFDRRIPVVADTTAMGTPHEVEYTLEFDSASLEGQAGTGEQDSGQTGSRQVSWDWKDREIDHRMELSYASQFSVEYHKDGSALVTIQDTGKYLVVPEAGQVPMDIPDGIVVIRQPLENIYLAATSAMDHFRSLDSIGQITLSGTDVSGWYIPEAGKAMEAGEMRYAGKYNAPDYEQILAQGCDLAIESTMIYHTPEVKEQLEHLGIPVLVERSSYESHPLGRMEWLRLYGLLLDKEAQADQYLESQLKRLEPVMKQAPTGKTAAFFYITSNGSVNVRKSGDYMAKLITLAGGIYVPDGLDEEKNALSTMNMQMEAFYVAAKDADYLIYNGSVDKAPESVEEFLAKSPLLADFKAVKEGHVWCTGRNLFQETMGLGDMLLDVHRMLTEEEPDPGKMIYLKQLQ